MYFSFKNYKIHYPLMTIKRDYQYEMKTEEFGKLSLSVSDSKSLHKETKRMCVYKFIFI